MTKYEVLAASGFREHKQGEEFEADLDPGLERRALARGQIAKAQAQAPKKEGKVKDDG